MSNFDSQKWYQITMKAKSNLLSLSSSSHNGTGSTSFQTTNTTSPSQQWQLFPSNNNTYVLRSLESTSLGYLTTRKSASSDDKTPLNIGNTVAAVTNYWKIEDQSMYWTILPWGDGSFWMENASNGSAWHMEKESAGLVKMSSNITGTQAGQSFLFKPLGKIGLKAYGTLTVPPSQTQADSSTTTIPNFTGTSSSSPSTSPSSSSHLSTAAAAGIGAGVGILSLLAILLSIFLLLRRRRKRKIAALPSATPQNHQEQQQQNYEYKYVQQQGTTPVAELWQPPVELASRGIEVGKGGGVVGDAVDARGTREPVELDSTLVR